MEGWRASLSVALVCAAALAPGCGGNPSAPQLDEVFYLHGPGIVDRNYSWEIYFPRLNRAETTELPRYVGVGIFDGLVRLSRPWDWTVRSASYQPGERYISYQSPRQVVVSIFERTDFVELPWQDILSRYEEDLKARRVTIVSGRMPVGSSNAQGRSYLLKVKQPFGIDFHGYAHEIILRGEHRVLLVQVLHGPATEIIAHEAATAVSSMLVY